MPSKNRTFVQFEVSQAQIDLLFPALKMAEGFYTEAGMFDVADKVGKLHALLKKQLFDFEEVIDG